MLKRQKEIDRKVDELFDQLYEVEGEIIDYLTYYDIDGYIHSIDFSSYSIKELNRIDRLTEEDKGSTMINALTAEVCQEILPLPDGSTENVLIELKGIDGKKYYLIDVRDSIHYGKGDLVKVIIDRDESKKYQYVYAIIHLQKNIIWTPILIERGRIASLKLGFVVLLGLMFLQTIMLILIFIFFLFLSWVANDYEGLLETFNLAIVGTNIVSFAIGAFLICIWWIFATEQDYFGNIYAEAVFKKLGFHAVKFLDLKNYSSYTINKKNKIQVSDLNINNEATSYLLDVALKEHNKRYRK